MIDKVKEHISAPLVLAIIHLVGIVGLHTDSTRSIFVWLTPFNLWFTACILIFKSDFKSKVFGLFFVATFLAGMLVEIAGVHTGFIFGEYYYTDRLGIRILEVPIIIGINWFILLYSSICFINHFLPKISSFSKVILAAFGMALIDFFIEPFAIYFNLWQWDMTTIPLQNYIAWFLISLVILLVFGKKINHFKNKTASIAYIILIVFFIINYTIIALKA